MQKGFDETPSQNENGFANETSETEFASRQQNEGRTLILESVDEWIESERVNQSYKENECTAEKVHFVGEEFRSAKQELQTSVVRVPINVQLDECHDQCLPFALIFEVAVHKMEESCFVFKQVQNEMDQFENEIVCDHNRKLSFGGVEGSRGEVDCVRVMGSELQE